MSTRLFSLLTLACALILHANPSWAELGGAVSKDAILVHTASPDQPAGIFEINMSSGAQIREYTNANQVVFAVSWQGPTLPNLKQLLGPSFDIFAKRPVSPTGDRHSAEFISDDLVVQSHGRMHNFAGRAYLPKRIPAGYSADQIK